MNSGYEDTLQHAYDAAKRREYYLRTRKLKGRKKADPAIAAARRAAAKAAKVAKHKAMEAKVNALKARLEQLKKVLAEMVKAAQARSGGGSASKLSSAVSSAAKPEKKTAKQEAAAKKSAEKYAKKHENDPKASLSTQAKNLTAKIATIEKRIAKLRAKGLAGATKSKSAEPVKSSSPTKK
jgi:hypothetical protein